MNDTIRQAAVAVSAVAALAASFVGSGAAGGTPIDEAAGGALAADATPAAPGGPAFAIWSVIYTGLVLYAAWQFLPRHRRDERQRRIGVPAILSLLLNGAWILSVQFDQLWLSVPVIVLLLAVLVRIFLILRAVPPSSVVETVLVDGTFGLYLGWVSVATVANIAAALAAAGFDGFGLDADVWGAALVATAGLVGVLTAIRGAGRVAPALSLCWGLAWIAVARLTGPLEAPVTAVTSLVAVTAVALAVLALRVRAGWVGHRPARVL